MLPSFCSNGWAGQEGQGKAVLAYSAILVYRAVLAYRAVLVGLAGFAVDTDQQKAVICWECRWNAGKSLKHCLLRLAGG